MNTQDHKLDQDLQDLLSTIAMNGEDNGYTEIEADLLNAAMQELISSEWFMNISPDRKKDLFTQYERLKTVLGSLGDFTRKDTQLSNTMIIAISPKTEA